MHVPALPWLSPCIMRCMVPPDLVCVFGALYPPPPGCRVGYEFGGPAPPLPNRSLGRAAMCQPVSYAYPSGGGCGLCCVSAYSLSGYMVPGVRVVWCAQAEDLVPLLPQQGC